MRNYWLDRSKATLTWDGLNFPEGTCNGDVACLGEHTFAPSGSYVATMCAWPSGEPSLPEECVEVPFEFPSSETYAGKLGW